MKSLTIIKLLHLQCVNWQCCNEDQKWTEDEDEESSDLENRPKTKTKILRNFEKSSKTFEYRNFFEDIWRTEDFRKNLKKIRNCRNICIVKKFWWNWSLLKFQHQKVFSIFIKGIYWFSSFFHQNSFNKRGFYLKNLRNLWPKIFEASKILRLLEMDRRRRRRWIFGQKSSKNEDLRSFVATLSHLGQKWK